MSLERLGHLLVSLTVLAVIYLLLIDSRSAVMVSSESEAVKLPELRELELGLESGLESGLECDLLADKTAERFLRDCH